MVRSASILDHYPEYELTIGIEVHTQLTTESKIFCSCPNTVTNEPNQNICMVCAGYPGSLPVLNKKVIDYAISAGLAAHCTIASRSTFDRKHYFYPDLPKNYQITQQDHPICQGGYIPIRLEDGSIKKINLRRIHIEEDAGKNIHSALSNESFVNLNRAGTPLLEWVSEPEISSTYEARAYLKTLHTLVQYLQICSGNMENGAFRADTNISVRKKGSATLGTKCELKNINSFKFIGDAIEYEIQRQIELLENGGRIIQETRLWDSKNKKTISMRSKEIAADYRFFQDPDLPVLEINDLWIERIKKGMPELPTAKFERLRTEHGLSEYEADIIVEDPELARYYETAAQHTRSSSLINWVLRDVMGYTKEHKITLIECKVTPEKLAQIIHLVDTSVINNHAAKEVFLAVAQSGGSPETIVDERGLKQIGSLDELENIVREVIAANAENVSLYKAGNERVFGFFVGQAMKKTQGKGNPKVLQELFKKHLG